jgi:adenylate kinase
MFIVFIGPPGAGKGTQAVRLSERLGIPHVSTGEILRQAIDDGIALGRQAEQYMQQGALVPDELVVELVDQFLQRPAAARGCLMDGFPRTPAQAEALDECLARHGQAVQCVIELQVETEELVRRLLDRQRPDDTPATIRQRLEVYRTQTRPLLGYYRRRGVLQSVPGHGSPDDVFARIVEAVPVAAE